MRQLPAACSLACSCLLYTSLGQPHLFGLLGRDETLVIPWTDIETLGVDAILVRTELPEPEAKKQGFWQKMRHWLDG